MSKIHNYRLNPPKTKRDLNKLSMLKYIQGGTEEDKKWFVKLMNDNKEVKINNLSGKSIDGYNMTVIREEFAQRFFPDISSKAKKAKKSSEKTKSFEDELKALLEK